MAQLTPSEPIEVYRWPVAIALAAVICVALYLLQPILSPFVLGGLIAYLGDPLVDRLESRGVGRTLGVAVVFLLFSAIITLAIIFALPMLLHQLDALISKVPRNLSLADSRCSSLAAAAAGYSGEATAPGRLVRPTCG